MVTFKRLINTSIKFPIFLRASNNFFFFFFFFIKKQQFLCGVAFSFDIIIGSPKMLMWKKKRRKDQLRGNVNTIILILRLMLHFNIFLFFRLFFLNEVFLKLIKIIEKVEFHLQKKKCTLIIITLGLYF